MDNTLVYISVFATALISGLSVLFLRISRPNLKLILSFSGAYLFGISVLHLLPEVYQSPSGGYSIGLFILAGFVLQILMEFFSEGIEHGHIHVHAHAGKAFPTTMMIALCVHSFLEGMPLTNTYRPINEHTHNNLLTGIILHNIPIAIALMSMLLQSHISRRNAILWLLVFASMTPLGTFSANFIGSHSAESGIYFNRIMGVVIGIFLHISTTILFESSENHRFNLLKFVVILLGAGAALVVI
ncbi:MAG TPA: ZIP family metal transporter [Bacteroidia bacterium]|jgi:zinc transporter ZupT